jgi:nicotinamide-nucleotide adenylyltransferase
MAKKFNRLGLIGRFKPLHLGGAALLEAACELSETVLIGIGSSNRYNHRNPFTAKESEEMIRRFLSERFTNYKIIYIPDFGHISEYKDGNKWVDYVIDEFSSLDAFVTGNPYVKKLLIPYYDILNPFEIIPKVKQIQLRATQVRLKMVKDEDWQSLVPKEVEDYLSSSGLYNRIKLEFGKEILNNPVFKQTLTAKDEALSIR